MLRSSSICLLLRAVSRAFTVVLVAVFAGCGEGIHAGDSGAPKIPESADIPVLQESSSRSMERDDPPAVRAKLERRQLEELALLRAARRARADGGGGCVRARPSIAGPPQPEQWLPPSPKVTARLLGRQVEVNVELQGNPSSLLCRPVGFTIVVSSGQGGTETFNNSGGVANYQLFGPGVRTAPRRFRVVGHLPYRGAPPYRLSASSANILGLRSRYVEQTLRCPGTGDSVRGCLAGPDIEPHAIPVPAPVLPLRGITREDLAASMRTVVAWGQPFVGVGEAHCSTPAKCSVAASDLLTGARGTASYSVQGEQVPGCWLATLTGVERQPADADLSTPQWLGGCVGWAN